MTTAKYRLKTGYEPKPEPATAGVAWKGYQLTKDLERVSNEKAIEYLVYKFNSAHGHYPTVILCAVERVCKPNLGPRIDVTVRVSNPFQLEPRVTSKLVYFCR